MVRHVYFIFNWLEYLLKITFLGGNCMAKTNDKQRTAPISRGPEAPKLSSDTNSKNSGKKNKPEKQK